MGSEDSLQGVAMGVEWNMGGGGRGRRSGVRDFLRLHDRLVLTPCLCFVLQLSDGLSHPCNLSRLPLTPCSYVPLWSLSHGERP